MTHIANQEFELSPYNGRAAVVSAVRGEVAMDPPRTKVAIIGAGPGRQYAPYDDPDWEIWSLNAVPSRDRFGRLRVDRWFEMHIMAAQSAEDLAWIHQCPVPIYLVPDASSWTVNGPQYNPQQVRYPLESIEANFGSYFTCSFAYEIALALHEKVFTDIGVYGGELCYGTERERTVEWACVSWWLGYAEGLGKTIHLPPGSHLGQHKYRYGIEYYEEKRDVESYVNLLRQSDIARHIDASKPYDSAVDFSQGG